MLEPSAARWPRRRTRYAALTGVGLLATLLVTLEAGPLGSLVTLFAGDHVAGAPLGEHERADIDLGPSVTPADAAAIGRALDERLRGVGRVVAVGARALTITVEAGRRDVLERLLAAQQGRFQALPVLEDPPQRAAFEAWREAAADPDAQRGNGLMLVAAADAARLRGVLARAERACPGCRAGEAEVLVPHLGSTRDADGVDASIWGAVLVSRAPPIFDERYVSGAEVSFDDMNRPFVLVHLTPAGDAAFEALSRAQLGRHVAIIADGVARSTPRVLDVVYQGPLHISLGDVAHAQALAEANELAATLRPGVALPAAARWTWTTVPAVAPGVVLAARVVTVLLGGLAALVLAWLVARALRVEPAPMVTPGLRLVAPSPRVWARAGLTLAAGAAPWLLQAVPLPGVDPELTTLGYSLGALGTLPLFIASLLVWLVVVTVPRLRRFADGSFASRAALVPATALVTLALAVLQALLVAQGLSFLAPLEAPGGVIVLALAAGTFVLWGLAAVVTMYGLGHGLLVITAGSALASLVASVPQAGLTDLAVLLVLATMLLLATGARVRVDAEATKRLPLAGLVPLDLAGFALHVMMLASAWLGASSSAPTLSPAVALLVTMLLALVLALLRAREAPLRALVPAALASALVVAAVAGGGSALTEPIGFGTMIVLLPLPLALADLGREHLFAAAHERLVRVASTHSVDAADALLGALAAAGVPAVQRAARVRALLWFMGPWLPIELLVPAARQADAEAALRAHAHAGYLRPFAE